MKQEKRKKQPSAEYAGSLDELKHKTTTSSTDTKKHLCIKVFESFRKAVNWYEIKKVFQTDLKPISVLALDYLFPKIYGEKIRDAFLHVNNMEGDRYRKEVINYLRNFEYIKGECVVDLNIMRGNKDPYRTLMTAESEAYSPSAKLLNKRADIDSNDMLWDLYKLLHYPSPYRLFITLSSVKHHEALLSETSRIIKVYADYIRPGNIFAIQIPTGNLKSNDCSIAYWSAKQLLERPAMHRDNLL